MSGDAVRPQAKATPPSALLRAWQTRIGPGQRRVQVWLQSLAPGERQRLVWAGALLLVLLVFWLGVRPAWRTLEEAPQQLNRLDAQVQRMNQLAAQARVLRAAPAVSSAQSSESLKAATDRLGAVARLNLQGERATVTLTGASPEALAEFLREVRSVARAQVIEARLSRKGTVYGGTLVLALGGGAP